MKQKIIDFIKGAWVHGLVVAVVASIVDTYFKFNGMTPPLPPINIELWYGAIVATVSVITYCVQHFLIPSTSPINQYDWIDALKTTLTAIGVFLGGLAANGFTGSKQEILKMLSGCGAIIMAHIWLTLRTATQKVVS